MCKVRQRGVAEVQEDMSRCSFVDHLNVDRAPFFKKETGCGSRDFCLNERWHSCSEVTRTSRLDRVWLEQESRKEFAVSCEEKMRRLQYDFQGLNLFSNLRNWKVCYAT